MKNIRNVLIRTVVLSGVILIMIILSHFGLDLLIETLNRVNVWLNQALMFFENGKENLLEFVGVVLLFSIFMEIFGGFFARMLKKVKKRREHENKE